MITVMHFTSRDMVEALFRCSKSTSNIRTLMLIPDPVAAEEFDLAQAISRPILQQTLSSLTQWSQNICSNALLCLPCEILIHILLFLPLQDMANFRLSSKRIAELSKVATLPQPFWAIRLVEKENELGFFLRVGFHPSDDTLMGKECTLHAWPSYRNVEHS
ncbi:hypothetical protein K469DRAFT_308507 [Zopfia rhizophila CBS 207.26]|uniref:F-box domain-containing protein n=1 Tax=Zopfia rhizophila CBS 207.26 TaxID=1314779 RepID=A0A6A6EMJ2_9PEZI|nr:hypothetical protein K469DRAFT_308507 [Zopfia rhizophila CBS 207.26]